MDNLNDTKPKKRRKYGSKSNRISRKIKGGTGNNSKKRDPDRRVANSKNPSCQNGSKTNDDVCNSRTSNEPDHLSNIQDKTNVDDQLFSKLQDHDISSEQKYDGIKAILLVLLSIDKDVTNVAFLDATNEVNKKS